MSKQRVWDVVVLDDKRRTMSLSSEATTTQRGRTKTYDGTDLEIEVKCSGWASYFRLTGRGSMFPAETLVCEPLYVVEGAKIRFREYSIFTGIHADTCVTLEHKRKADAKPSVR